MKHHKVKITRRYYCKLEQLWQALADGCLLAFTGANKDEIRNDFKVGGKIYAAWNEDLGGGSVDGEYLKITPHSQISLSWTSTHTQIPSVLNLTLSDLNDYCELTLNHDLNTNTDIKNYDFGWDDALLDLKKYLYQS